MPNIIADVNKRRKRREEGKDKDKVEHGLDDEFRESGCRKIGMAISAEE